MQLSIYTKGAILNPESNKLMPSMMEDCSRRKENIEELLDSMIFDGIILSPSKVKIFFLV